MLKGKIGRIRRYTLVCWSGTQTATYVIHGRFVTGFQNIAKERGIKKQGAAFKPGDNY